MRLTVEKGELPLPDGFSFEIEVNNPFFSDEGTAAVPVTIPSSGDALDILGHPERPGRSRRHIRTVPAMLQHGVFQRRCNMLVETCGRDEGISVSLAFTESELYTNVKDKQLKDLFRDKMLQVIPGETIGELVSRLYVSCYKSAVPPGTADNLSDFRIFPVAVEKEESDGQTSVKLLNEPSGSGFVYEARTIQNGGEDVDVPEGYGVTPFLFLHRLITLAFELCGYTVVRNDFNQEPFVSIVVLNNCSDTLCKGSGLCYCDLVPSMTVGELIVWLKDRFGAAVSVRHDEVSIALMQNSLAEEPDMDFTSQLRDRPVLTYPASSRVVLSCSTDLDSAEPAAETLSKLREKFRTVQLLGIGENPGVSCLVFRIPLGKYYTVSGYYGGIYKETLAGSNCFTYDRENADNAEEHSAEDRFVPEIDYDGHLLMPYIGDRLHYNTNIAGETEEAAQALQICYAFWDSEISAWFGSTQSYSRSGVEMKYPVQSSPTVPARSYPYPVLTPDGLYKVCWELYNNLLLNSAPEMEVQIDFTVGQLLSLNLMCPKLLCGQRVMIKSLSYEVGSRGILCGKCRLQLLPEYVDGIADEEVTFEDARFGWRLVNDINGAIESILNDWEDYEVVGHDGLPDYTADDAPNYIPNKEDAIEKTRLRRVTIVVFDAQYGSPETGQEKVVNYYEYFISISLISA